MAEQIQILEEDEHAHNVYACCTCGGLRIAVPLLYPVNSMCDAQGNSVFTVPPGIVESVSLVDLGVSFFYCVDCDDIVDARLLDKKEMS